MSASEDELRRIARHEIRSFWIGLALSALAFAVAVDFAVLFFIVPKFEEIFRDALPGKPLPSVTEFIIHYKMGLALFNLGWPIAGFYLWKQQNRFAFLWVNIGLLWFLFQMGITIIALFMPMVGTTTGMSDTFRPMAIPGANP